MGIKSHGREEMPTQWYHLLPGNEYTPPPLVVTAPEEGSVQPDADQPNRLAQEYWGGMGLYPNPRLTHEPLSKSTAPHAVAQELSVVVERAADIQIAGPGE